ncbi:unnamed protein product [Rotaria sordida]|uniref:Uncharacterized protein n=2 Tax=Rotaria sordida TaxID=392033 RepID=A0A814DJX2_9BILA|nr:unnamed protein product [Rotaria sordida]CAF3480907.1 unnamed protein product [Rotaria sordida]
MLMIFTDSKPDASRKIMGNQVTAASEAQQSYQLSSSELLDLMKTYVQSNFCYHSSALTNTRTTNVVRGRVAYRIDPWILIECRHVKKVQQPYHGELTPRETLRNSVLVAFCLCMIFQIWILLGANLTIQQHMHRSGRLPTSVNGCLPIVNITQSVSIRQSSNNLLLPLYSVSVMWYSFNGVFLTITLGLLGIFIKMKMKMQ